MVFAGLSFLYCFLPAVLIVYYAVPRFLKNYVLLVASLVFYYIGEQRLVWVMITSILLNYGAGLLIQRFRSRRCAKVILGIAVASDLVILCYYKYTDFFICFCAASSYCFAYRDQLLYLSGDELYD